MNSSDICGNCTACCKLLGIGNNMLTGEPNMVRGERLHKPAGVWCKFCAIGKGCTVYEDRPPVCVDFECMYLQGMLKGEKLPPELRPDRCGVVLSPTTDGNLAASCDPHKPEAWRRGEVFKFICAAVKAGITVTISSGPTLKKRLLKRTSKHTSAPRVRDPRGGIVVYEMLFSEPDEDGMQWSVPKSERIVERIDA